METSDQLWQLLRSLLQQLPSLLTLLGCVIFAISRWKRDPQVSLFAGIGLVFLILHAIVFAVVYVWVPGWLIVDRSSTSSFRSVMLILGLIFNTTLAIGFTLLLVAIFMRRPRAVTNA